MASTIFIIIGIVATVTFLFRLLDQPARKNEYSGNQGSKDINQAKFEYFSRIGKLAFERGEYENAINSFNSAYQIKPDDIILIQMAGCYSGLEDYEKCIEICNDAISNAPLFTEAYLMRSACNIELNNIRKAIEDLKTIVEIEPARKNEVYPLIKELEAEMNHTPNLTTSDVLSMIKKASEYRNESEFDKAIEIYQKLLEFNNTAKLYNSIVETLIKKGDFAKSVEWCNIGLKKHPNSVELLISRATINIKMKDFDQALNDYNKICEISPSEGKRLDNEGFVRHLKDEELNYLMDTDPWGI